ncbi:MAG TPA: hypothetical protein PKD86_06405 [Gemmatales bacterium]|nr:hypothetical protein [Gemmatales bacterium]HMP58968.1 hypothetical protein [Gemmatales bacterium]
MVRLTLAVVLALSVCLPAPAQTGGDPLDEARRRQEVAAQALEQEIVALIADAERHWSDPARALPLLEQALEKLGPGSSLSIAKSASLKLKVQEKMEAIKAGKPRPEEPVRPTVRSFTSAQDQEIKRELETINKLQEEKRFDEANQVANRLFAKFPDLVAADQSQRTTSMDSTVRDADQVQRDKARGFTDSMRSVERSSIPMAGNIQYPSKAEWDRIKERAKRLAEKNNPTTPQEREILKKLDMLTREGVRFRDMPLNEVITYLEREFKLPIFLSKATLQEMNLEYNTPVTVTLPNQVTRRTVLRTILADLGLTYIIKNEVIQIVSQARANQELVTRVVAIDSLMFGQNGWNADALIDFIQQTVEPHTWKSGGGEGTISFYAPGRCLIIRNSAEVISRLEAIR